MEEQVMEETTQIEEVEAVEEEVETAPPEESVDAADETPDNSDMPDGVQQRINKFYADKMKAERAAAEAQRELQEKQKQIEELTKKGPPTIPELGNRMDYDSDADYMAAVQKRDEAVKETAIYEADQRRAKEAEQEAAAEAERTRQKQAEESAANYAARIKEMGFDETKTQEAEQTIAQFKPSPELAMHLLQDKDGPAIVNYLAGDLEKLGQLVQMTPLQAGSYIEQVLRPASQKLKPKQTETPEPVEILTGKGQPEKGPGPPGATYE